MSIKSGRYGKVSWDPAGGSALVQIISINAWKGDFKTDYEDVSFFCDANRVYVPGLMDIGGSFNGFWNSAELALCRAAMSPTPGTLELMPNTTEPSYIWKGPAYMDASIDCSMAAPKVTGSFKASGDWGVLWRSHGDGPVRTGLGGFAPTGAMPPANFAALTGVTASPATAWTTGHTSCSATAPRRTGAAPRGPSARTPDGCSPATSPSPASRRPWCGVHTAAVCRSWTIRRSPKAGGRCRPSWRAPMPSSSGSAISSHGRAQGQLFLLAGARGDAGADHPSAVLGPPES